MVVTGFFVLCAIPLYQTETTGSVRLVLHYITVCTDTSAEDGGVAIFHNVPMSFMSHIVTCFTTSE